MTHSAALLQESDTCKITGVQFGLLNPEKVRRQSVVAIISPVLYTRQLPAAGGMNDLRMGTCDRRMHCATCRHDIIKCPGHYGHLDLAAPMYHVSMISVVLKMLRCVCVFCSHMLADIDEFDPRLTSIQERERLAFVTNLCKSRRRCPQCETPQPKFTHVRASTQIVLDTTGLKFESEEEEAAMNQPFTAARARTILAGISDANVRIMGPNPTFARPEWMILTVLQIPPPISRPCITASDGSRTKGQDDVTVKLVEIFKANKAASTALREAGCRSGFMPDVVDELLGPDEVAEDASPEKMQAVQNALDLLQQHLVHYFYYGSQGTDSKMIGTGGRAHCRTLRLIPDRWRTKKGRFRGNLGGKRVDFSSRTVASPAPDYDVNEVGIPEVVANHLTFPERVTPFTRADLTARVRRGFGVRDGASTVIVPGCDPIDLGLCTNRDSIELEDGWVVERHLVNGDWVLLNRQPSLHRMSIMAHKIRIIPDKTFRLPVCDTTPYNADFDGDELNVHVLQTHDARAEAEALMSVNTQMISPETNKPIVALVQDSLVAAFLMSQRNTFLHRHQAMQMLMTLRYLDTPYWLPPPAILKPTPLWTGKQLFSLLFPKHLVYDAVVRDGVDDDVGRDGGWFDFMERRVRVYDGDLVCGSLCKKTLGTSANGIVHVIIRDWGFDRAARFVSDAQRLLQAYMLIRGFSVGVGDCVMGEATHDRVNSLMNDVFSAVEKVEKEARSVPTALVDGCVTKMLGAFLTRGGAEVVKDVNVNTGNRVSVMIESGAKGSPINSSQILSAVGQQNVEGGRIPLGVDGRTLPCFRHGDASAKARGFVCNSYNTGLTPTEYFFHAMGGREGLVDTAVKTSSTGYLQRRLSKAQEGLQVGYDTSTVRNASGSIIQFYYGGDSFYPTHLERTKLKTFTMDDASLRAYVVGTRADWTQLFDARAADAWIHAAKQQFDTLKRNRDKFRRTQLKLLDTSGGMVMPTNPPRLFKRAMFEFKTPCNAADLTRILSIVHQLIERVRTAREDDVTRFTCIYLRSHFTLREMVVKHRLGTEAIQWVCDMVWKQYNAALAEPGEMVGTLGASSIGAPCTQMTLVSLHELSQNHPDLPPACLYNRIRSTRPASSRTR